MIHSAWRMPLCLGEDQEDGQKQVRGSVWIAGSRIFQVPKDVSLPQDGCDNHGQNAEGRSVDERQNLLAEF
ncbi:MAG: hypothetical protein D6732_02430 [Methanobacteriota archaeon]|nr:MAG: hypothetical protein D6732_02430 [Euryarchaeota archaeon]